VLRWSVLARRANPLPLLARFGSLLSDALVAAWRGFLRTYGANPLHFLVVVGVFTMTGYVALRIAPDPMFTRMLVWFGAAVLLHDLVLFPIYTAADRSLIGTAGVLRRGRDPLVRGVNHVRVPVLASGLLFLLFLPGIIQQGAPSYLAATGQTQEPFLERWLLLSASFAALSTLLYLTRLLVAHGRRWWANRLTNASGEDG
jgi:hypothetical protein